MQLSKIIITLKGKLEGVTKVLNRRQFVDGVFSFTGSGEECQGLANYYASSYNCDVWMGIPGHEPKVEEEILEEDEEVVEEEREPSDREQSILDAINLIDPEDWIDDVVNHPPVTKVAELIDDVSVTKEEIVDVIEAWMVDEDDEDTPDEE